MKKGMRLLALVTAALLLGGCGTPLYELTDEEENLIVQGAAYMVAKYNIFQKDGMNSALPEENPETEQVSGDTEEETGEPSASHSSGEGASAAVDADGGTVSLAESIGYKDRLEVDYEGYSLMDVYQEESYFSLSAGAGNTFVVMRFTLNNPEDEALEVSNYGSGYSFYLSFEGADRIAEKQSIIADSFASFEGTVPANGSAGAVLIFEITKEQAEIIGEPVLTMEYEDTVYLVSL